MGLVKLIKRGSMAVMLFLGVMAAGSAADAATDPNQVISVYGKIIDLKGHSVVITGDSNNASIYLDEANGQSDGNPDNNTALAINNATSYNLSDYTIYGCQSAAYKPDKDLSIYVKGGTIGKIYGVYNCTIDNSVKINISGGRFLEEVIACTKNAHVKNAELIVTGGTFAGSSKVKTCNDYSNIHGNSVLQFSNAILENGSGSDNTVLVNADFCTVDNDLIITLGNTSDNTGTSACSAFYGCRNATVKGNMNVKIIGNWNNSASVTMIDGNNSEVQGDFNLDWVSGNMIPKLYCLNDGEIKGGFNVNVKENAVTASNYNYIYLVGSVKKTVRNISVNIPSNNGYMKYSNGSVDENLDYTGYRWFNPYGNAEISSKSDEEYIIRKDLNIQKLTINNGAKCKIDENVVVNIVSGAGAGSSINGIIDNYGEIKSTTSKTLTVSAKGKINNYGKMSFSNVLNMYGTFNNYGTIKTDDVLWVGNSSNTNAVCNNYSGASINCNGLLNVYGQLNNYGNVETRNSARAMNISDAAYFRNKPTGSLTLNNELNNPGKLINEGQISQTYNSTSLGNVYTTNKLNLYQSIDKYAGIYYKIDLNYPTNCIDSATIAGVSSSNFVKIDGISYMKAGQQFKVTLGSLNTTEYKLTSVKYGSNYEKEATSSQSGVYLGTMVFEPTTVKLNFEKIGSEITNISLNKTTDKVENLKVGQYNECFYDLDKELEIRGDSSTGAATYSIKSGSVLPEGITFSNGKISGTPTKANNNETTTTFIVKGANQTTAEFVLTFGKINKGDVSLALPTNLSSFYKYKLKNVNLPVVGSGTYRWENAETELASVSSTGIEYAIRFKPNDVDNYDWVNANITNSVKTPVFNGTEIEASVLVKVLPADFPEEVCLKKLPDNGFSVVYGKTINNIVLPSDADGAFSWQDDAETGVGVVGKHKWYLTFIPADNGYNIRKNIPVWVNVTKADPVLPNGVKISTINAVYGNTLADVALRTPSGGQYQWITPSTTYVDKGVEYKLGYKPNDRNNYDWSKISSIDSDLTWNSSYECVEFKVTAIMSKASPDFFSVDKLPKTREGEYGKTLSTIEFDSIQGGKCSWLNPSTVLEDDGKYWAAFKPSDLEHYDWSVLGDGWNEDKEYYVFGVSVTVRDTLPDFSEDVKNVSINAVYGDTLEMINLGTVEGGTYQWVDENVKALVQNGASYKIGYKPSRTEHYAWNKIPGWNSVYGCVVFTVRANVAKATPKISKAPVSLKMTIGQSVSSISLPKVKTYKWYQDDEEVASPLVSASALPDGRLEFSNPGILVNETNAKSITLKFIPNDSDHYNTVENISISIMLEDPKHSHVFRTVWDSDDEYHWKSCESCGERTVQSAHVYGNWEKTDEVFHKKVCGTCDAYTVAEHTWNSGVPVEGGTLYVCSGCGHTKRHNHVLGAWKKMDGDSHKRVCDCGFEETGEHDWDLGEQAAGGTKVYICNVCGDSKEHIHSYGNYVSVNESYHERICTDCEYSSKEAHNWIKSKETATRVTYTCSNCGNSKIHDHEYGDYVRKDDETHWKECDCGVKTNPEKHDFDDWKNKDDETHYKKCKCGYIIEAPHEWDDGIELDDGYIQYYCKVCKKGNIHKHSFDEWLNDKYSHWQQCDCGMQINLADHVYDEWQFDAENHWRVCECGYESKSEHIWTPVDVNENGEIEYVCMECETSKSDAEKISHVHNWGDWEMDEQSHWKVCICGEEGLNDSHKWNEGENTADGKIKYTCTECEYFKYEDIPQTPQTPQTPQSPVEPDKPVAVTVVPVGGKIEDTAKNVSVKVTKAGVVDANGKLVGAEAVYTGAVKKTSKIVIPDVIFDKAGNSYNVTSIAPNALKNDKTVTTVKIGNNIVSIGSGAFSGCVKLKSVLIGNNVTKIDNQTFAGCKKLKTITIKSTKITKIGKKAFKGINKKAVFKVPKKKLKAYKKLFKSSVGFKKTMKIKA